MKAATLKALKASIAKGVRNAKAKTPDDYLTGPDDCPLCHLFNNEKLCVGCPVYEKTGKSGCEGTPYDMASALHGNWEAQSGSSALRAKALSGAKEEVKFLKSLLPKGEGGKP